jgi:DNA-binding NarL/FixJ family response regulator
VLLSNHSVPRFLATLPPESMAGWCYLLKKSVSDVATLTRSLEGAAAGLVVLDPHLVSDRRPDEGPLARLTDRAREILELIAQGYTNAAIAERLVLSERTVENRLNQLYHELGLASGRREFNPRVRAALIYLAETRPAGIGSTSTPVS